MVKQLNDNSHLERLGGIIFADYKTAMGIFENTKQLDYYRNALDKGSIYALTPTATVTEGTKKLQYQLSPKREIKSNDIENAVGNQGKIQLLLNNGIDVDELSVDYFTQLDKNKEKKPLPTNKEN
jgi:hypothetical protein